MPFGTELLRPYNGICATVIDNLQGRGSAVSTQFLLRDIQRRKMLVGPLNSLISLGKSYCTRTSSRREDASRSRAFCLFHANADKAGAF